ncbi:MAG: hypothetical protein CME31_27860 [Gimesia sp.]|uniref:Uncharacterized protein n=1 Tax=Gimesia maris TaxID=122 RepID=A0A3D3QYF9_9PLAN|nr:hypothetical protein [Gimesia sp.]HCO21634.1 hypothetical protein [Gimesia maris]
MNGSLTKSPDSSCNEKQFRLRKYYRNVSFAGLLIASFMTIGMILEFRAGAPANQKMSQILLAGFICTFFMSLSIWLILTYHYASLTIQDNKIIEQGVLLRKELDLDRIRQLRWIASPSGGIKLKTLTEKIRIYLKNFPCEDRLRIVEYLRAQIPEPNQEGWDLFCHRVAMPLRRYDPQALPVPDNDEVLLTRKRWDRLLLPWILLFTVGGVLAAWKFNLPRLLSAPLTPTALWLFLRFSTPKQGMVSQKLSADKETSSFLIFSGGMVLVFLTILVGHKFIELPFLDNDMFMICLTLIWMPVVFWNCYRHDKIRHKKQLEASKTSVKEWEAGNTSSD